MKALLPELDSAQGPEKYLSLNLLAKLISDKKNSDLVKNLNGVASQDARNEVLE